MPRCQNCGSTAHSYDLRIVDDAVVCSKCGRPKLVEDDMATKKKRLVSVTLHEVSTADYETDHELEIEGEYAGLEVRFKTTFDDIRTFFTKRREAASRLED
jgi:DNA-directed RNA polymerase subunit M/transcription elongation factor TFIIS